MGYEIVAGMGMLSMSFHLSGKVFGQETPLKSFPLNPEGEAEQGRLANLLDVLCGYLNTGGSLVEVREVLDRLQPMYDMYRIELPAGWRLMSWEMQTNPDQYLFVNEQLGLVSIVTPEEYTEMTTLVEFAQGEDIDLEAVLNSD